MTASSSSREVSQDEVDQLVTDS